MLCILKFTLLLCHIQFIAFTFNNTEHFCTQKFKSKVNLCWHYMLLKSQKYIFNESAQRQESDIT